MESLAQESLGTGLQRQISKFSNMQNTVSDLYFELEQLVTRCETLKKDCASRTTARAALKREVEKLLNERDGLVVEVREAMDHASPSLPISGQTGYDAQGKLNRRIWLLEQDLKAANRKLEDEKMEHNAVLQNEIARSNGLLAKVTELEIRIKEGEKEMDRSKKDWETEMANKASQRAGLATELQDVRESLQKERENRLKLQAEVGKLRVEKASLQAEMQSRPPLETAKSPASVLRSQQPNIVFERSKTPSTPSKKSALECAIPSTPSFSPTSSLTKRFTYLEERHHLLKGEYDKLRAKYSEDLKHWKEYKAAETARIDHKRKRKAERREARAKEEPSCSRKQDKPVQGLPNTAYELVEASDNSQLMSQEPNQREVDGTGPAQQTPSHQEKTLEARVTRSQSRSARKARPDDALAPVTEPLKVYQDTIVHRPDQTVKRHGEQDVSTPVGQATKRIPQAGRVTPWLGSGIVGSVIAGVKRGRGAVDDADDVFNDSPALAPSGSTNRTPLVRDRGSNADLRRSALANNASTTDPGAAVSPPGMEGGTAKRKHVDLEHLSPAQKAAELKKLSKMTTKEKRKYYAEYKGKGRYLTSEQIRTGVHDEYEIDPDRNEGEKYRFHDVKRQKADRRLMHGGDCECCKEYYDAVGPIPRYHQGPQWRDPSPTRPVEEVSREAELQEHQNKVSRHRETWRRAPTPPGFWEIGFPTTQAVAAQNAQADEMVAKREAEVRRDAAHRDSKWRKKQQ